MLFYRRLYTLLIVLMTGFVLYNAAARPWLQTDLAELLPQTQQDIVLRAADTAGEAQLNSQIILLAGSDDAAQAFQTASTIAGKWRQSGLFEAVDDSLSPDLAQVREDMQRLGLAVLPAEQRAQLADDPQAYFRQRAEDAANPFATSPLPLEQDWLGFGRFVADKANPQSRLQWNPDNGMLFTEDGSGKTWVWLRGRLPENGNFSHEQLLNLMTESRQAAQAEQVEILTAGGALFAAHAKTEAERESSIMSVLGILLTFALMWRVFRSGRTLALLLPLSAGMLAGLAASLAVFGHVHVLTLVIGTSLIGMLVDFPLHWLAPSVFGPSEKPQWQAWPSMKHMLPGFAVSLLITVSGYILLGFTPLPVLRQTAVFSAAALLGAFGATVLWLPYRFQNHRAQALPFAAFADALYRAAGRLKTRRKPVCAFALLFALAGVWRSDWHDDIRQWANMPSEMLQDAHRIGALSGTDFSGQYLVAEAENENALLHKNTEVLRALQPLAGQGKLDGVQSLAQFISPTDEQNALKGRLKTLADTPQAWRAMSDIGVPETAFRQALLDAAATPPLTLSDGLKPPLAEAWRNLYLGEVEPGRFASVIRLQGLADAAAVRNAVADIQGVHWADKRGFLNESFVKTRNQAAWLKLFSYALALLLLWKLFGLKRGGKILAVPLAAAVLTVAFLGFAGIPVSLFAMFGLLLVSAIGVDYSVYALTAPHSATARFGGMLLAAATTGISFVLLAFSGTPAVAAFGMTVAAGTLLNLLLASLLLPERPSENNPFRRHTESVK
ncbi:MMPL family transporter [Neisseria sp. CCUG12390]|uniref:MMPL family transporter n=1 Tax=Neisseria sp. CCUG12390 TaxID=3392035 RepID=UPI003A1003D4